MTHSSTGILGISVQLWFQYGCHLKLTENSITEDIRMKDTSANVVDMF